MSKQRYELKTELPDAYIGTVYTLDPSTGRYEFVNKWGSSDSVTRRYIQAGEGTWFTVLAKQPKWQPQVGDPYFSIRVNSSGFSVYKTPSWQGSDEELDLLRYRLVFETKNQALLVIDAWRDILRKAQEVEDNGN